MTRLVCSCPLLALMIFFALQPAQSTADPPHSEAAELLERASQAGSLEQALQLANEAVKLDPKNDKALYFRSQVLTAMRKPAEALKDLDELLKVRPDDAELFYVRGRCRFCAGQVEAAVEDFDKYVKLKPAVSSQQWERGIALYYAGKFSDGADQFALYQTYHDNDVENATWRYLCMARKVGVEKARAELLPIENDRRVPMMQIYALYRGEMKPEEVMEAARNASGDGPQREARLNNQLFYAHLYLGLYYEAAGNEELAREHILTAADKHPIGHYMWDVAKIHADRLRAKSPDEKRPAKASAD